MKYVEVVCAIIVNSFNEVFITKRGPGRPLSGKWEFPGGKVELNETYEETIIREIKEELSSLIIPIKYVGKVYHEYSSLEEPFFFSLHGYICKVKEGNLVLNEHTDSRFISVDKLKEVDFAEADKPFIEMIKDIIY